MNDPTPDPNERRVGARPRFGVRPDVPELLLLRRVLSLGGLTLQLTSCNFSASEDPGFDPGTDDTAGPLFGGQTGDGSDPHHDPDAIAEIAAAPCPPTNEEVVDDPDQVFEEIGFSANELLGALDTEFQSSLRWAPGSDLETAPESGAGAITLSVEYDAGEIRHYVPGEATLPESSAENPPQQDELADALPLAEPDTTSGSAAAPSASSGLAPAGAGGPTDALAQQSELAGDCGPRIEVDAVLVLTTPGGALEERFPITLSAASLDAISYTGTLPYAELQGELRVGDAGDAPPDELQVSGVFTPWGVTGGLSAVSTASPETDPESEADPSIAADGVAPLPGLIASWPDPEDCPQQEGLLDTGWVAVEPGTELAGFSVADVDDSLGKVLSPQQLFWADGEQTELSLELGELGSACVLAASAGRDVRFTLPLHAATSDGRLDGEYTALGTAWGTETGMVSSFISVAFAGDPDDLARTGLRDIDLKGAESYWFFFGVGFDGQQTTGSLSLQSGGVCEPEAMQSAPAGDRAPDAGPSNRGTDLCSQQEPVESATIGSDSPK